AGVGDAARLDRGAGGGFARGRRAAQPSARLARVFGEHAEAQAGDPAVGRRVGAELQFFHGARGFGRELEGFLVPAGGLIGDRVGAGRIAREQDLGGGDRRDFDRDGPHRAFAARRADRDLAAGRRFGGRRVEAAGGDRAGAGFPGDGGFVICHARGELDARARGHAHRRSFDRDARRRGSVGAAQRLEADGTLVIGFPGGLRGQRGEPSGDALEVAGAGPHGGRHVVVKGARAQRQRHEPVFAAGHDRDRDAARLDPGAGGGFAQGRRAAQLFARLARVFGEDAEAQAGDPAAARRVGAELQFFHGARGFGRELEGFLVPAGGLIGDRVGAGRIAREQHLGGGDRRDFDRDGPHRAFAARRADRDLAAGRRFGGRRV